MDKKFKNFLTEMMNSKMQPYDEEVIEIKNKMEQMIEANGLEVDEVCQILFQSTDFNIKTGEWAYYATNVAELRDVIGEINWRRMESAFHGFVLDKDTVREFWNKMDENNKSSFLFETWRCILKSTIIHTAWHEHDRANVIALFEVDDIWRDFEDVLILIKAHTWNI